MDTGDALLLYAGGLIKARRDGEIFGESKLLSEVQALAELAPSELAQKLYWQALEYSGGAIGDDLGLLAIRLQPATMKMVVRQRESVSSSTT